MCVFMLSNKIKDKLIQQGKETRGPRTLAFLCLNFSGDRIAYDEQFQHLYDSIIESESNAGPLGQFNLPGYPDNIMVVGKFGSVSNAVNPISKMTKSIATDDSLDIILLSLLPDFMVNSHRPKDTVLIGIGQPSTLCVAHEDLNLNIPCRSGDILC
ncbi:hypothetical protein DAPPUDRAFT_331682 [Daphnia pulex]|uniref:Uncharacterized protein n=1 Tax=Daphnia pulex TaxID=6669 RepID=E9HN46_DAPPU|nr:hypothetical protein DAPPUDRAFT_331682 [Daphnia pulex]|eukprot:EFX66837.1 hypothetical protein DAPPUDRAFT_331682 [Daphnia pulex]